MKSVALVGTASPERSFLFAELLRDCIDEHGWGERLRVIVAGLGAGAGGAGPRTCPDVERVPGLLAEADVIVVDGAAHADHLLEWAEAEGKQVLALSEFVADGDGDVVSDPDAEGDEFLDVVRGAMRSLLGKLVAERP